MRKPLTSMNDLRITLLPAHWECAALPGRSVLESAELGGVILPSSCRNGSCRTCITQLDSGAVRHRIEWPSLSKEEKSEGWILPCVAEPLEDVVLRAPAARRP